MRRVNRVSYLHYVLLFAISLIGVTTGVTLWMTYKQALVVYELNSARMLTGIARSMEIKLDPAEVRRLTPLNKEDWAKRAPTDPISAELTRYAQANGYKEDDGGAFMLIKLPPAPTVEGETTKLPPLKESDIEILASNKGLRKSWWVLSGQYTNPELAKVYEGEPVLFKGKSGDYVGTPGIWTAAAVPLKMEGGPYVLLFTAHTDFHSDLSHFPFRDLVPVIVVVFLVVMAISIFFAGHIISAIWTALKAMRKLSEGELDYRLSRRRNDEFGLLFRTFNNLADHLELRDEEFRKSNRLMGEALNSSGAPVAVCLPSGALLYASDSALSALGISHKNLPGARGSEEGEVISIQKRLVQSPVDGGELAPVPLSALDAMPQDHPELEISAYWLPTELKAGQTELPARSKVVQLSLVALPGAHPRDDASANADSLHAEGYLLIFSKVEDYQAGQVVAASVEG